MSLALSSGFGGTGATDYAVISYNARPTAITVACWLKGRSTGSLLVTDAVAESDPSFMRVRLFDDNAGGMAIRLQRQYSGGNLQATGNGRAYPTDWQFWAVAHDGGPTSAAIFREPAGPNFDFVASQDNGTGTLGQTAGTLRIGYDSNAAEGTFGGQIAELAIFDYVLSSTDLDALQGGANPMSLAVPPVWYNRMRTAGTGADAQVGTITSMSGPNFVPADNPTVADPVSVANYAPTGSNPNSWTTSTGSGTVQSMVDEATRDDSDYMQSPANPVGNSVQLVFANILAPASDTGHVVSYALKADAGVPLSVNLLAADSTLVKTWTHNPAPTTFTQFDQSLTTTEADTWAAHGYPGSTLAFTAG